MSKPVFITIHFLNKDNECINWVHPTEDFQKSNEVSCRIIRECAADYDDVEDVDSAIIYEFKPELSLTNLLSSYTVKNHEKADVTCSIATFTDKKNQDYKFILYRFNKNPESKEIEVLRIFANKDDALNYVRKQLGETMEYKECDIDYCSIEMALERVNSSKERWIYVVSMILN